MARLIRTEKEVEGRFEEVWIVVEEDPLEQWPEGPLTVVGRPAPRKDGPERVRGEARYPADLKLPVWVWQGESDHLVRPAHAHYLSAVLPNATLVLYPADGHLLLLQHWDDILAAVTARARTKDRLLGSGFTVVGPHRPSRRPWRTTSCA